MDELNQDQKDFLLAIKSVSPAIARHLEEQMISGASFDEMQASLGRAFETAKSWRIGRDV